MLIHHAVRYIGNDMGNFGGTVFTEHVHFKHAIGVRAPSLFPPYPRVIHHDIIINGIGVAYPGLRPLPARGAAPRDNDGALVPARPHIDCNQRQHSRSVVPSALDRPCPNN